MKGKSVVDLKHQTWVRFEGVSDDSQTFLKPHIVHKSFATNLSVDMMERTFLLTEFKKVESLTLDEPGPIFADRPYEIVRLDSLKISIPSEDVKSILTVLRELPRRKFKDGVSYFKLKTWNSCLIMNEIQKDSLETGLESLLDRAQIRAEQFYEEKLTKMKNGTGSNN